MKVIDEGHSYALKQLDGEGYESLVFVKREGERYPGNVGHHAGTNMQEVLRALIHRTKYLNAQIPDMGNNDALMALRDALYAFEVRAAQQHGRPSPEYGDDLEDRPVCQTCGHIGCVGNCLAGLRN